MIDVLLIDLLNKWLTLISILVNDGCHGTQASP